MSKNESLISKIVNTIGVIIVMIIGFIVLLFTAFWYGVLYITPEANLTRNSDGMLQVNTENYEYWHVHSRIFHSSKDTAVMGERLLLRAAPKLIESCEGIKQCDLYESKFYRLSYKTPDVYLLQPKADAAFTDYINKLKQSVKQHNEKVTSFDSRVSIDEPELDLEFAVQLPKNSGESLSLSEIKHNNTLNFAAKSCRNNGGGCDVKATVRYSYGPFPYTEIEVSKK